MNEVHQCLTKVVLQELESNERKNEESDKSEIVKSAQENLDQLGIKKNLEGVKCPNFAKMIAKRCRKSLKKLSKVDGKTQE